eukprot:1312692-Pleurochrysis_carterae.AAC.2
MPRTPPPLLYASAFPSSSTFICFLASHSFCDFFSLPVHLIPPTARLLRPPASPFSISIRRLIPFCFPLAPLLLPSLILPPSLLPFLPVRLFVPASAWLHFPLTLQLRVSSLVSSPPSPILDSRHARCLSSSYEVQCHWTALL